MGAIRVSGVNIRGAPFMDVQGRGSDSERKEREGGGEKRYEEAINTLNIECFRINKLQR